MYVVVGPVLTKEGSYPFDFWTLEEGLSPGHIYRHAEDAYYARSVEIRSHNKGYGSHIVPCATVDQLIWSAIDRFTPLASRPRLRLSGRCSGTA
jgi:hypothetical protein